MTDTKEQRFIKLTKKLNRTLMRQLDKENPVIDEFQFILHVLGTVMHATLNSFTEGGKEVQLPIFDIWSSYVRDLIEAWDKDKAKIIH